MADQWSLDLQNEWSVTDSMREREKQDRKCIGRVPHFIRCLKNDRYTPNLVSLGPYHNGSEHLRSMERMKRLVLGIYLRHINIRLETAIEAMKEKVGELMDAYEDLRAPWTDEDQFVQLMIVDGCFLLQWLCMERGWSVHEDILSCFVGIKRIRTSITRDMLLLENQLPVLALLILTGLAGDGIAVQKLHILLPSQASVQVETNYPNVDVKHLLHAFYLSCCPTDNFVFETRLTRRMNPPTITELVKGGVKIERSGNGSVVFENGVLKLPQFIFKDYKETSCLNLMALENMLEVDPKYIAFIEFFDSLVDSGNDAAILRNKGIIAGATASDEEVAAFFNNITQVTYAPARYYPAEGIDVSQLLIQHCGKWHNKARASFKASYLSNPWVFLSFISAGVLLVLTVLQTIYTVESYYKE